jgi:hypothetical protein
MGHKTECKEATLIAVSRDERRQGRIELAVLLDRIRPGGLIGPYITNLGLLGMRLYRSGVRRRYIQRGIKMPALRKECSEKIR